MIQTILQVVESPVFGQWFLGILFSANIVLLTYLGNAGSKLKGVVMDSVREQIKSNEKVSQISDRQIEHIASTQHSIERIEDDLKKIINKKNE